MKVITEVVRVPGIV